MQLSVSSHNIDLVQSQEEESEDSSVNFFEEPDESDSAYLVRNDLTGQVSIASYGAIKSVHLQQESVFELKQQLELAKMSEMLYNRWGR